MGFKLEVQFTVWCSSVENFCRCTFQGSLVGGVVGHYADVCIMVPLRLVGANVNLKNNLQFLVSSLYRTYCWCMFDGCVFNANSSLFHRSFHYFGFESCAFVCEYGVRNVQVSGEDQSETFYDQLIMEPSQGNRKHVP